MGWQEDRALGREDDVAEKAQDQQWWQENFPEPTMDDLAQEQFRKNELAELARKREALEKRMDGWSRV